MHITALRAFTFLDKHFNGCFIYFLKCYSEAAQQNWRYRHVKRKCRRNFVRIRSSFCNWSLFYNQHDGLKWHCWKILKLDYYTMKQLAIRYIIVIVMITFDSIHILTLSQNIFIKACRCIPELHLFEQAGYNINLPNPNIQISFIVISYAQSSSSYNLSCIILRCWQLSSIYKKCE